MDREALEYRIVASLIYSDSIDHDARSVLQEQMFSNQSLRELFIVSNEIRSMGIPMGIIEITTALKRKKRFDYVGGMEIFRTLSLHQTIFVTEALSHCLKLAEYHFRSVMIHVSSEIMRFAMDDSLDVFVALSLAQNSMMSLSGITDLVKDEPKEKIIMSVIDEIENADSSKPPGVPTHIPEIDNRTGGLMPGGIIAIGGRPAMGKTALAVSISNRMSLVNSIPGAFFSLEMSTKMLYKRFLAINGNLSSRKTLWGGLTEKEITMLESSGDNIINSPLQVFDKYHKLNEIVSKIRTLHQQGKLKYAVIDYLQLVECDTKEIREQQVARISRTFKLLAMELNIPIIVLSQLSRAVETRGGDKRPVLSDLRESGSLEQDSELVMFCYRPSYYGLTDENGDSLEDYGFILVGKNRNDSLKDIKLAYRHDHNQEWASIEVVPSFAMRPNTGFNNSGTPTEEEPF